MCIGMVVRLALRSFRQNWASWLLAALLAVAFILRAYGLNWDRGQYFHPDERQILMVVERLKLPSDWRTLWSAESPLNPRFFAYGSLPIYLLRVASWLLALWDAGWSSLTRFYLLGRILSAALDTCIVAAAYVLAGRAFRDRRVAVATSALLTFTVLHIQLAHFYTVDTLLALLILLAVDRAMRVAKGGRQRDGIWLGVWLGAALATKLSVLPLVIVTVIAWLAFGWPPQSRSIGPCGGSSGLQHAHEGLCYGDGPQSSSGARSGVGPCGRSGGVRDASEGLCHGDSLWLGLRAAWHRVRRSVCRTLAVAALTFLALQPYALIDAVRFGQGVVTEIAMSQGWADFPYTRQYLGTPAFVYQVRQMFLFTLGPGLTLMGLAGLLYAAWRTWRQPDRAQVPWLAWVLLYGLAQGVSFVKFVRYMLPLSPFLCMTGAALLLRLWDAASALTGRIRGCAARASVGLMAALVLASTVFYALAFARIYSQPHPWLQATAWICTHAPSGSKFSADAWDDVLPLEPYEGDDCPPDYSRVVLDLHAADTAEKRAGLLDLLESCDYIVLPSDRLYAPLSRFPQRYPLASHYYQQLFAGHLGFELVAAPAVYPSLAGITLLDDPRAGLHLATPPLLQQRALPGLVLNLGRADESFTVYDHPQPLIFARVQRLSREDLERLLKSDWTSGVF